MPLRQVSALIEQYGQQLIANNISDEELDRLLAPNTFTRSDGYVDPNGEVTDSNHSVSDAMKVFVLTIAPQLDAETLHAITTRLITRAPSCDTNTFLRNTTLEKYFLAYDFAFHPEYQKEHLSSTRIVTEFNLSDLKDPKCIQTLDNLQAVILAPLVKFFKSPETRFAMAVCQEVIIEEDENTSSRPSSLAATDTSASSIESILTNPLSVFRKSTKSFTGSKTFFSSGSAATETDAPMDFKACLQRFLGGYTVFHTGLEMLSGSKKMADGEQRSTKKRKVAQALIAAINNHEEHKLDEHFILALRTHGLSVEEFFESDTPGKVESLLGSELSELLKSATNIKIASRK